MAANILRVEETGVPGVNYRPLASNVGQLSHMTVTDVILVAGTRSPVNFV